MYKESDIQLTTINNRQRTIFRYIQIAVKKGKLNVNESINLHDSGN